MRTQTVEPGEEPKFSGWSNRAVLTTKSLPDQIFLNVTPKGPTQGEAIWDLPEGYQDWPWGVDLQYRLVRLGGCKKFDKSLGEPVIMENVQDKQVEEEIGDKPAGEGGPENPRGITNDFAQDFSESLSPNKCWVFSSTLNPNQPENLLI